MAAQDTQTKAQVPVWDPDSESLRAVNAETAQQLQQEGYATGAEAQGKAIRESAAYKAAGFAAKFGEAGSAGLSNLANLLIGNKTGLREVKQYQKDNPYSAGAASFLGYGASFAGGAGRIGAGLAGKATGTAASIAAHTLLPGAAASAVEGAANEFTEESLLKDPVNLERIAASALTHVMYNSVGNIVGYGIGKAPAALRSSTGNVLDFLERVNVLKPNLVKDVEANAAAAAADTGPKLSRFTVSAERGFEQKQNVAELARQESIDDITQKLQFKDALQGSIKRTQNVTEETLNKVTKIDKETASSTKAAVENAEIAELTPDEIKPEFAWPKNYNKAQKLSVLRGMIKERLGEDATHLQMWNEVQNNERKIQVLQSALKNKEITSAVADSEINSLIREKEEYKTYFNTTVPSEIRDGKLIPGFEELNDEYARVSGNQFKDLERPEFGIPKATPKQASAAPRVTNQYSDTWVDTDKYKRTLGETSNESASATRSGEIKTRDYDKEINELRQQSGSKESGKFKATATFTFPKTPPKMRVAGYKDIVHKDNIRNALLTNFVGIPVVGTVGSAAAAGMQAVNLAAKAAGYREPIGNFVQRLGDQLEKVGTPLLRTSIKTYATRGQQDTVSKSKPIDIAEYAKATDVLNRAAVTPEAVAQYMQQTYPAFHAAHPEAAAAVLETILQATRALNDTVPKRPYTPTLRDTPFVPPRSQQHRILSRWQILSNPQLALRTGDPQTLQILRQIYPKWYEQQSGRLVHDTQAFRGPVAGQLARNITAFTGSAVNPLNNAAALKRMQGTAGPMPQPNNGQQGPQSRKIGRGPQSAKVASNAAQRDDPSFDLN